MRLSFWLRGIAGAAAAIYLTKGNRRPMVMSTMTSAGQSLGKMFNNAKSAVADRMESKTRARLIPR
ncbi:hypothetical protein N6H14_30705 [Paenibacillus sp. CC-CFT747]|nr:hypothetical protein N6H14_30705 [Paenibacillus sp. CC-CFT747]